MKAHGGRGVLMAGVPGVYAAKVVVIGAGVSGLNATAIAAGMRAVRSCCVAHQPEVCQLNYREETQNSLIWAAVVMNVPDVIAAPNAAFRTGSLTLGSSDLQAELPPAPELPDWLQGRYSGHSADRLEDRLYRQRTIRPFPCPLVVVWADSEPLIFLMPTRPTPG